LTAIALWRRLLAEYVGSALLAAVVIGSGIAAQQLSPGQTGLQLFENAAATAAGLFALILMVGAVSGAHFNPVVSFVDAAFGGLSWRQAAAYLPAQVAGCISGAILANAMFGLAAVSISTKHRASGPHFLSEIVATAGLILIIFALARSGRIHLAAAAVGAYIGAAYWFTSSTSFANPAITVGRMFSNTFAGIEPSSVPSFVGAQIIGGLLAIGLIRVFYPDVTPAEAATVVIPHPSPAELVDPQPNGSTGSPDPTTADPAHRPGSPLPPPSERWAHPCMLLPSADPTPASRLRSEPESSTPLWT
jgi:arsenate reductase